MIIAIASGKGGTGKTTVATSLALTISELSPIVLDCDVEAPNAHLFLEPDFDKRQEVSVPIPEVDENRCNGCGVCAEVCQYHAIVSIAGKVLVFPQLCHGCGSCTLNCPEEAITEFPRPLGVLEAGPAMAGIRFARGVLNIGEPMAVPVIRELKHWHPFPDGDKIIIDAPPGTSCPVVESIRGADFVLLITEPTPFGLHDLRLAVKLTRELGLPTGVVINRDGVGDTGVDDFCENHGLPILMRIPLDRRIGEAIARGQTLVEALPEYQPLFQQLYDQILLLCGRSGDSVQSPSVETQSSGGLKARSL
jgi:MinD superfamily P-loop ATPase